MNDKIKQAFEECEKFIDEHTPEQVAEIEEPTRLIKCNDTPIEDVYNIYYDTTGNLHWIGTKSGEHIIRNDIETIKLSNTER